MKLNKKVQSVPVFTHEGGPAKKTNALQQLRRSVLANMLWEDSFYENGEDVATRIQNLVKTVSAKDVSALAIETRTKGKLRHVPLLLARTMSPLESHKGYVANTLASIIQRPDELTEFLSIYWKDKKQPLSSQVKKGLGLAFGKFNEYQLAKYNNDSAIKLRDVLFLTHPKPADKAQDKLWKKLIGGHCKTCWKRQNQHDKAKHEFVEAKLETPDTWEVSLSASKGENKKEVWTRLLQEDRLGGLALLRNLRNFKENGVDENLVRKALKNIKVERILPYRFIAAAKYAPNLEPELEEAMFKAVKSKGAKIKGKTVLLIDVSGSMESAISDKSDLKRLDAACGLAILARELFEDVEIHTFSNTDVQVPTRRGFALRDAILGSQSHGGTYLGKSVDNIGKKTAYDRIIVFSDEQTADKVNDPRKGSRGYMINIASNKNGVGYGAWTHLDGFSENVLDYIIEFERLDLE